MANYQNIVRLRPEVREFIRNRRWVHRGDVITYGPNIACDSFSTDAAGFRHSRFGDETLSVADCLQRERYGLVLGPSNVYGFGLGGNGNTIPRSSPSASASAFANVGLPEGNSRNLYSLLAAFLARASRAPAAVLHLSGGDFTSFCYTSIADPVFGSPNLKQIEDGAEGARRPRPAAAQQISRCSPSPRCGSARSPASAIAQNPARARPTTPPSSRRREPSDDRPPMRARQAVQPGAGEGSSRPTAASSATIMRGAQTRRRGARGAARRAGLRQRHRLHRRVPLRPRRHPRAAPTISRPRSSLCSDLARAPWRA